MPMHNLVQTILSIKSSLFAIAAECESPLTLRTRHLKLIHFTCSAECESPLTFARAHKGGTAGCGGADRDRTTLMSPKQPPTAPIPAKGTSGKKETRNPPARKIKNDGKGEVPEEPAPGKKKRKKLKKNTSKPDQADQPHGA